MGQLLAYVTRQRVEETRGLLGSFGEYRGRRDGEIAQWLDFLSAVSLGWKPVRGRMKAIPIDRPAVSIVRTIQPPVFWETIGPRHAVYVLASCW